MRHSLGLAVIALSFLPIRAVLATQAQTPPIFKGRAELVELDVSVLDSNHRPVRGLGKSDFTVLEDGRAQNIVLFEAINTPPAPLTREPWASLVTQDVASNQGRVSRLWVIVIDDALIPTDAYAIKSSLEVARGIIRRLAPGDVAAVVYTVDSRRAQDFTDDQAKLLAALDQFNPGWASGTPPPVGFRANPDWLFWSGAVQTLGNVMDTLTLMPHHHKAVLWVSGGIDFTHPDGILAFEPMHQITAVARAANVPIYSLSPCGLMTEVGQDKCSATRVGLASLAVAASDTNGRFIPPTNDYTTALDEVFEENSSYYLLGFTPQQSKPDGHRHALTVRVNRPGLTVRTRDSYVIPKELSRAPQNMTEALARLSAVPIPVADLPLTATAIPLVGTQKKGSASVVVVVGFGQSSNSAEGTDEAAELSINAYTTEGSRKATQRSKTTLTKRAAGTETHYEGLALIDLAPGRYRLRIAAALERTGSGGTVMTDVVVPDFAGETLSASGLLVGQRSDSPAATDRLPKLTLPLIPTAIREFNPADHPTAALSIYQKLGAPAQPVAVRVQLIAGDGRIALEQSLPFAPEAFTASAVARAANVLYELPLAAIPPGQYLLRFDVSASATTITRATRFSLK